ncbi:MAG: hypothetical protein A3C22_03230 [Candidatus Levybacteria bacterium RIFCSPHIGHO2_02_FULL_37_10]|nr:MAG: hypothetical protein A3C22_03230 [Candidatus Levybacteria bacterium RIFCSPHIGHO2_02_FULL_37_10]
MDILEQAAEKIITEQEKIIGPIALEQAKKVPGLTADLQKHEVKIEGNQKEILQKLVEQYQHLFGQASVEVCKDAVRNIIKQVPSDKIPSLIL